MVLREALSQVRGEPVYAGHLSDGSSIQRHSAGDAYPFIVQFRDDDAAGIGYCEVVDSMCKVRATRTYPLSMRGQRLLAYGLIAQDALALKATHEAAKRQNTCEVAP